MPINPRTILVCGLEHILPKIERHYALIDQMGGTKTCIHSRDDSGLTEDVMVNSKLTWIRANGSLLKDMLTIARLIRNLRPRHVEIYHEAKNPLAHLAQCLLLKMNRIPMITVCRGRELLDWQKHSWLRKTVYSYGFRNSALVIYKELYMPEILDKIGISSTKRHFWYNRIPRSTRKPECRQSTPTVLFLNSWKPWRNVDVAVKAAIEVLAKRNEGVKFVVAGYRENDAEKKMLVEFRALVSASGNEDKITFKPFGTDAHRWIDQSDIFLLPADIVFLNFTLLEAMQSGSVPVISNAPGAATIVANDENGFIVPINPSAFAEKIEVLLDRPEIRKAMGAKASATIETNFNLENGIIDLLDKYKRVVWRTEK